MQPADAATGTHSTTDRETATVSFTLLSLERARDRGRLLGLASAEILLAGVAVTLQGIRIIYEPDGSLLVQPPRFRHPDGHWLPAVILPPELANAIAAEVLDAFGTRALDDQGEAADQQPA
jgi:hypothetical protein